MQSPRTHAARVHSGPTQDMFASASVFNQPLDEWDVGQVSNMHVRRIAARVCGLVGGVGGQVGSGGRSLHGLFWMLQCAGAAQASFRKASAFNQPIHAWDVSLVTNMGVRRSPPLKPVGPAA